MTTTPPSTPPSPASPVQAHTNDHLSDIFSDSPSSTPSRADVPSDIPRLRSTHATAGYRAGISISKTHSLQPGFDEGYSIGAVFGLRIGYILGALKGLWAAYATDCEEKDRLDKCMHRSRQEMKIERIFGRDYWDKDGVWTYEVNAKADEVTFQEVAEQHPILREWDQKLKEELQRAGVKLGRFEGSEWEAGRVNDEADVIGR